MVFGGLLLAVHIIAVTAVTLPRVYFSRLLLLLSLGTPVSGFWFFGSGLRSTSVPSSSIAISSTCMVSEKVRQAFLNRKMRWSGTERWQNLLPSAGASVSASCRQGASALASQEAETLPQAEGFGAWAQSEYRNSFGNQWRYPSPFPKYANILERFTFLLLKIFQVSPPVWTRSWFEISVEES